MSGLGDDVTIDHFEEINSGDLLVIKEFSWGFLKGDLILILNEIEPSSITKRRWKYHVTCDSQQRANILMSENFAVSEMWLQRFTKKISYLES